MIGSTNAQPKIEKYTEGKGIKIINNEINIDTSYPSQYGLVEGANTLSANILSAMENRLPIIINSIMLTFMSDDGSVITYSRDYERTNYKLTDSGVYTISPLPQASYNTSGAIKLGSDTQVSQAVEQVSSVANRQYAVQVNGDGRASVNVPWTDTTYSNGDGLNLSSGNVFSVDFTKVEKSMTEESYTITSNSWTALASSEPFKFSTTVTATYTIGNDTEVGIINDQAVLFANYGFIVGSVSGQNVTIYSIAQPDTSVTLKVGYRG